MNETTTGIGRSKGRWPAWGLFVAALALSPAFAGAAPALVDRMTGTVEQRTVGAVQWQKVYLGDKLAEGTRVRTGPNSSLELLTPRGHRLQLKAETSVELTALQDDETKTRLEGGRLLSKVKHLKKQEGFSVQTPTAVCAVRGTEFETTAGDKGTLVAVFRGVVGVSALGADRELALKAGQMTSVHDGTIELPRTIPKDSAAATESPVSRAAKHEVGLDMSRNEVIAAAALEQRMAEYQEGKSLIDVEGKRVRVDEYVVRPRADQFKFVILNERESRLDYFYYQGTFNTTLPADLSLALKDVSGRYGSTAPDYYLKSYEMGQSNTQDSVHDTASGGHLVKVEVDGSGDYVLTDAADATNTRTVQAAQLMGDGNYKVYDPLSDSFSTVTPAQKAAATKFGIYVAANDTFKDLAPGDTVWKTRFNNYTHALNHATKISYDQSATSNVLASSLDATWNYAGGFVLPVVETDANKLDVTITNYYGDGTYEKYRTTLINDQGERAPLSAFAGVSTGAAYKNELLKWNYEQQVEATEFEGRKIDLVAEPKIFIKSGLIQ